MLKLANIVTKKVVSIRETLLALPLDDEQYIAEDIIASADIRKVLKLALLKNATAIVLAHNHPSGSLKPGAVDDTTTRNLGEACRVMNIRLLDHLIVHGDRYYSYAEQGRLP